MSEHGPGSGPRCMPVHSWSVMHGCVLDPVSLGSVGSTGDPDMCSPVKRVSDALVGMMCACYCARNGAPGSRHDFPDAFCMTVLACVSVTDLHLPYTTACDLTV